METDKSFIEQLKHGLGFKSNYDPTAGSVSQNPTIRDKILYIWDGENQKGPYTFDQVSGLWKSGQIAADSFYIVQGDSNWTAIMQISTLLSQDSSSLRLVEQQKKTNSLLFKFLFVFVVFFVILPAIAWLLFFLGH